MSIKSPSPAAPSPFSIHNPATGEHPAKVAHCGLNDVDKAVKAPRRAFEDGAWSRAAPEHRKEAPIKLIDLVSARANELAVMESTGCGKAGFQRFHRFANDHP